MTSAKTGIETLLKLYSKIEDIPEPELAAAGYCLVRSETDGRKCYQLRRINAKTEFREPKKGVFSELEFLVHKEKGVLEYFSEERSERILTLLGKLDSLLKQDFFSFVGRCEDWLELAPESAPIHLFASQMADYLLEQYPVEGEDKKYLLGLFGLLGAKEELEFNPLKKECQVYVLGDLKLKLGLDFCSLLDQEEKENRVLTKKGAKKVLPGLQRLRARTMDCAYLLEKIDAALAQPFRKQWKSWNLDRGLEKGDEELVSPKFKKAYASFPGTWGEFYLSVISDFLDSREMQEVAANIKGKTLQEAREYLGKLKNDALPSYQREKELRDLMGSSPVEEKKQISQSLAQAKQKLKLERQIVEGVRQYLDPSSIIAGYFGHYVSELEGLISIKEERVETFYLNGEKNHQLDKNPGVVSGDCTKNEPLCFWHPMLHNVKVFNPEREYVGNIYLLETYVIDISQEKERTLGYVPVREFKVPPEGKRVWHLDAIQIPVQADWKATTDSLVKTLSLEAQKRGVAYLTANSRSLLEEDNSAEAPNSKISNYDYIQRGVMEYLGEKAEVKGIAVPVFNLKGHSELQGGPVASVLWKKE